MTAQFLMNTTPMSSAPSLISEFSDSALASPFRSTVPLLALVKDDWTTFAKVLTLCNVTGNVSVAFERKVPSPKGEGLPSQTDAMVLFDKGALAIEAKWTEPRYETVATRLARKDSKERDSKEFVGGWLDLLRPHATNPLRLEDFATCVYQVLHRAASACGLGRTPSLAYLHFTPTVKSAATSAQYVNDLSQVHALLGNPRDFPFFVIDVPMEETLAFRAIRSLKKGVVETGRAVRAALLATELFEFGEPHMRRIGADSE
jgi:uncharacterized protein DUF6946